MTKIND